MKIYNNNPILLEPIDYLDISTIKNILISNTYLSNSKLILTELLDHLNSKHSFNFKVMLNNKIIAIWFSLECVTHTSLSYFYIDPSIRHTKLGLTVFKLGLSKCNPNKPLLLYSKDISKYKRNVTYIKDDLYVFKGFN